MCVMVVREYVHVNVYVRDCAARQDVAMLHYADHFDEMDYKATSGGQVPHRIDGVEGRWYW